MTHTPDYDDSGDFLDDVEDCPNCGGEGVIYMCLDEIGCLYPEEGCDLCERPCDWCRPISKAQKGDTP